jgi:uncharacterized coiled-coil protein SlyX
MHVDLTTAIGLLLSSLALLGTIVNAWIVVRIHIASLKTRISSQEDAHYELKTEVRQMDALLRQLQVTLASLDTTLKDMKRQ